MCCAQSLHFGHMCIRHRQPGWRQSVLLRCWTYVWLQAEHGTISRFGPLHVTPAAYGYSISLAVRAAAILSLRRSEVGSDSTAVRRATVFG